MINIFKPLRSLSALLPLCLPLFFSCGSAVNLTASWSNANVAPAHLSNILVVAFGNNLQKRKLGEDHLRAELQRHDLLAVSSIDQFGHYFAEMDSVEMRQKLLAAHFDGIITIRVLNVNETLRWEPGHRHIDPVVIYRSYNGYYYRIGGYYRDPGYTVTDVEVLLESNLYRADTGELLWSGQSKTFSGDPTDAMATRYAKNIVADMIRKKVVALPRR